MPLFAVVLSEMLNVFQIADVNEMRRQASFWAGMFVVLAVATGLVNYIQIAMFCTIYSNRHLI
jgi:hypothetical protein